MKLNYINITPLKPLQLYLYNNLNKYVTGKLTLPREQQETARQGIQNTEKRYVTKHASTNRIPTQRYRSIHT